MKRIVCLVLLVMFTLAPLSAMAGGRAQYHKNGDRESNKVSITVDDWWDPGLLTDFLDAASEYGVKLTLYPSGCNLHAEDRALWQRALDEGHEIGSHGFAHVDFTERKEASIARDFERFSEALDNTLGYHYQFLSVRIPFGASWADGGNSPVGRACHAAGYDHVIFWDLSDTKDVASLQRKTKGGSIILMHANRHDLRVFRELMEGLKGRDLDCVTISTLLGITTPLIEDEPASQAAGT